VIKRKVVPIAIGRKYVIKRRRECVIKGICDWKIGSHRFYWEKIWDCETCNLLFL